MRPITLTTSDASGGEQASSVCPLDIRLDPFSVTMRSTVTGTATYTVEYTTDDIWAPGYVPAAGNWSPFTAMSGSTVSAEATIVSPVTAIRLRQTLGNGSVALRVVQAGF